MELLKRQLDEVKIPGPNDKIYKDECMFSFDTPVRIHILHSIGYDVYLYKHFVIHDQHFSKFRKRIPACM